MQRALLCMFLSLAACGSGAVSDTKSTAAGGSLDITSADDIETICSENEPTVVTLLVEFPATEPDCPFGVGDNLDLEQSVITARVEQNVELALPEGVVVCDLAFDFQAISGGEGTPMVYDDNFWFTFDDVVLAGSYGPMVDQFRKEGSLPLYEWSRIVGTPIEFDGIDTYCLGETEGRADCEIPPPETNGIMSLSFDDDLVNELSFRAVQAERFDFSFITMGDNDPELDCAHEEFAFVVEVPYVRL
jgi:hypothetical protein